MALINRGIYKMMDIVFNSDNQSHSLKVGTTLQIVDGRIFFKDKNELLGKLGFRSYEEFKKSVEGEANGK